VRFPTFDELLGDGERSALQSGGLLGATLMSVLCEDSRKSLKKELSHLYEELEIIDKWDRMFETAEHNADSYVARMATICSTG
jgi:hypothetical protein